MSSSWASTHPQQIEFDRLNLTYTLLSKRKLLTLVQDGLRERMGRSAHADAFRHPAARLHARGHPQFLRSRGRVEDQRLHRAGAARTLRPRRLEQARAARHGRFAPLARGHRQLPARTRWRRWRPSTTPKTPPWAPAKCRFRACSTSSRTIFAEIPPKQYFRLSPGREVRLRYGYFITCTGVVKDERRAKSWRCIAPTIPPPAAATRPTAAR